MFGKFGIVVDVDGNDLVVIIGVGGQLLEHGSLGLSGAAPVGVKVDEGGKF